MVMARKSNHPEYGIHELNRLICCHNGDHTVEKARFLGLRDLRGDLHALKSLANHLKNERMPHWQFLNGDDYQTCLYVLMRMSQGADDGYKRTEWGDNYIRVRVNIDPDKMAVVKRHSYKNCYIHKDEESVSKGHCSLCYYRMRRLMDKGIIFEDTSIRVLTQILRQPKYPKGSREFIRRSKEITAQGMLCQ